jgi:hypothetical protein
MTIFKSASKIVFILMALGILALTYLGRVEAKDFVMLAGMAFTFYFSQKGESQAPFAGK